MIESSMSLMKMLSRSPASKERPSPFYQFVMESSNFLVVTLKHALYFLRSVVQFIVGGVTAKKFSDDTKFVYSI